MKFVIVTGLIVPIFLAGILITDLEVGLRWELYVVSIGLGTIFQMSPTL